LAHFVTNIFQYKNEWKNFGSIIPYVMIIAFRIGQYEENARSIQST